MGCGFVVCVLINPLKVSSGVGSKFFLRFQKVFCWGVGLASRVNLTCLFSLWFFDLSLSRVRSCGSRCLSVVRLVVCG